MPIDTSRMLVQLSPIAPLVSPSGGGGPARANLRLQRQRFEEEKRQNREMAEWRRLQESGEMARAQLAQQQAQAKLEADQAAKVQEDRLAAYTEFTKLNGQGDIEGARAMVPMMTSLGMGVDLEGEEGGLPRYRIEMDAEAAARAAAEAPQVLGYPEDETGALDAEPGIPSTEDAFRRAQGASAFHAETGQPLRAPDAPDFTGGVPKNVIDLGAMQASTMQRLAPALGHLVSAMPDASGADPGAYRRSAMETAQAVSGMGLPGLKALEKYKEFRTSPENLITSQMEAAAQQGRFEQTQNVAASKESQSRYDTGFGSMGKEMASKYNVEDLITARDQTKNAKAILMNPDPTDDQTVLALVSRRLGERGATTEGDVKRVTGQSSLSWINQIQTWLERGVEGGLTRQQRNALVGILDLMEEGDIRRFNTFQDRVDELVDDPDTDRDVARGLRDYSRVVVPADIRASRKKKTSDAPTGASPIPETARIAREHNNPGNLKFADQTGAEKGEEASDGGSWAKFKTYEDGLAALKSQVEKDAKRGLTVEQFVTKYAPPDSNDTAKYIADAVRALGAAAGQKLSELDADKVTAFVAKKESGTEVGATPVASEGKPSRARELLKKGGY